MFHNHTAQLAILLFYFFNSQILREVEKINMVLSNKIVLCIIYDPYLSFKVKMGWTQSEWMKMNWPKGL